MPVVCACSPSCHRTPPSERKAGCKRGWTEEERVKDLALQTHWDRTRYPDATGINQYGYPSNGRRIVASWDEIDAWKEEEGA